MITGNEFAKAKFRSIFNSHFRSIVCNGTSYVGKRTFINQCVAETIGELDILLVDGSISEIRSIIEFFQIGPVFSQFKIVIVDNADKISEPAQDALLKVLEEPPSYARIILVTEDYKLLLPALQSRFQFIIDWHKLSESEMNEFIADSKFAEDTEARKLSDGRPGLYQFLSGKTDFTSLYGSIINCDRSLLSPIPRVILDLKHGPSIERDAIIQIIRLAARSKLSERLVAQAWFEFSSILQNQMAADAEIYWRKVLIELARM